LEPGPGNGGATPHEPASPGQNGSGNSPSGPAQLQSPAGAGDEAGEGYGAIAYELSGVDPAASPRRKRRWLTVRAGLGVLSLIATAGFGFLLIKPTVTEENDSQKEYDASQPPFTASMQPEKSEPREWVMVLDRELTAHETQKLTSKKDSSSAFSYLQGLGGRPLAYASVLEHAPKRYREQQTSSGGMELSDTFKMSLLSTRAYAVVIDDWEVVDVTCERSTVKTVVAYPPQGGVPYEGILLHIPPRADEPVLTDDTEGQGEPYFDTRFIEVGGGQPSGGLRVEAIAPPGQSCEWGIKVHYVDAHQKEQHVQLKDSKGKPLRIRTESVPENPRQQWVFGSVPWTPCHEKPQEPMCDAL
jgi:hypothetical protein